MPFTYSGVRSENTRSPFESGWMVKSSDSCLKLVAPVTSITASCVSTTKVRACARPSLTAKSPAAQLMLTCLSPNSLVRITLPTFRPIASRMNLLTVPCSTRIFSSPLDAPSSAATELPVADSRASPLISPMLACIDSMFGNSCRILKCRAASAALACIGADWPSSRRLEVSVPPATPKFSGSSVSTASCSLMWVTRWSIGRSAVRTMRSPVNFTSASMAFQRSVRNGSTGSTLSAGWRTGASRRCLLALESAPMIGARSANNNWCETSSPVSCGRCPGSGRMAKVSVPPRSEPPTRPVNCS